MDISVENYESHLKNIEQSESRRKAVEDLLQRVESVIEEKNKQLQAERKEFADDLTSAVDAYTHGGVLKTAEELQRILEEDENYHNYATELCNELLSETDTAPIDVFGFTGGSLPAKIDLFSSVDVRDKLGAMVQNVLKQQTE